MRIAAIYIICLLGGLPASAQAPFPNARQLAWQNGELGALFSYDLHVFDGVRYQQEYNRITPIPDYNIFDPPRLNTDQWIRTAKAAGCTFAVLTVTHETGFALYQSDVNPYCLKALRWQDGKGDIVRDFVNSCRKYGIKPGLFIGIRWNSFFGVHDYKVIGTGKFRDNRQAYYNHMIEGMVKELCTRYGPLFEIWFDGGADDPSRGSPDVLPIIKKYQPDCLFYHNAQLAEARWGGSESGTVGYPCWSTFPYPSMDTKDYPAIAQDHFYLPGHGDTAGRYWMPAMGDAPLRGYNGRHEWFWEPDDESHIFPLQNLLDMYDQSVGRNATLVLGLTPDTAGLMPAADSLRLSAFGEAIQKRFSHPLATANTAKTGKGTGNILAITLETRQPVNQLVIAEHIASGERVRSFVVQALVRGKWQVIDTGSAIGHKYICRLGVPATSRKFRLIITRSTDKPIIDQFSVYHEE